MKRRALINRLCGLCAALVLAYAFPLAAEQEQDLEKLHEQRVREWKRQERQEQYEQEYYWRDSSEQGQREWTQERRRERRNRRERRAEERLEWRVKSILFSGNRTYTNKELASLMELKSKSRFTTFLMNADLDMLRTFYKNMGFNYAAVTTKQIDRDTTNRRVHLHIAIEEGPRTYISDINIVAERLKLRSSEMRRMQTKIASPLIIPDVRQDSRMLKDILGNRGFLAATVEPEIYHDSVKNLARVTFNIEEGPKAAAGNINITGNEGVNNSFIARELKFRSGDTLDLKSVRLSERRLYTTGLFSYVQIAPQFDSTRIAATLPDSIYDVSVNVSKNDFFRLRGGLGYSTDEGFGASGSATYINMFQRGQSLTLDGKASQISQGTNLLYTIPMYLLVPFQFDTKLYYNWYDNNELYLGEFGGVLLSVERETDYFFFYRLWSQWEYLRWVTAPSELELFPDGAPEYPTQSIGGDIGFDTRNDLFNPTKGSYTTIGLEIAGIFGGRSNQYLKANFDTRWYFSHRARYFLSMAARVGWVSEYGGSETVPIQSKFYGGGGSTVRGFAVNRLATLPNGDPMPGNFYTFINVADIRFPIYWWINGAVFVDVGNVWSNFSDIESPRKIIEDLRWSAGPGLRIDTPIKLIARFDFGFKLDRRPGESTWELHFDLGQPF